MSGPLSWSSGVRIGLLAGGTGVLVLVLVGLLSGQDFALISAAGSGVLPRALAAITGLSAGVAYLAVHPTCYLLAGLAGVLLARVADRVPSVMTGLVTLINMIELGFLVSMTAAMAQGRMDLFDWRAVLAAHAASDIVFAVLLVRAHPGLVRDLRAGYET